MGIMYFLWPLIALCYCGRQECRNRWHPAWHQPVSCTEPSVYIAYVIFPFCLFPKQKAPADSPMLIVTFIQTFLLFCFIAWYAQRIQQRFKGILPVKTRIRHPPFFLPPVYKATVIKGFLHGCPFSNTIFRLQLFFFEEELVYFPADFEEFVAVAVSRL